MRRHARLTVAVVAVFGLIAPASDATPVDNALAAARGANRLLGLQTPSGQFPWQTNNTTLLSENFQGVTALGLVEAFKVSGDTRYLDAAKRTRNYLAAIANGGPCPSLGDAPPCRLAAPNTYFLTELALLTLAPGDFALARRSLDEQLSRYGGAAGLVNQLINVRRNAGYGNLGLWDTALFIRAASDVGRTVQADQMAAALNSQSLVNPLDSSTTYYELGLAGMILGLSESDVAAHIVKIQAMQTALKALQVPSGSFPSTFEGDVYDDDTQSTAYAVMALSAIADIPAAQAGADFLRSVQRPDGGFAPWLPEETPKIEFGQVDAEAIAALVAATLLVPSAVVSYTDIARVA